MNLIVDIGNTRIKAGVFQHSELKQHFIFNYPVSELTTIKELISKEILINYTPTNCIVASVADPIDAFINYLKEKVPTLLFTGTTPTPLVNVYKSAGTLGSDRLAAAVGGHITFPGKNILVIDTGTCVKYNFITNDKYIGGAISPGLKMRFNALHTFTSRLPLIEPDENFETLIGTTTNESILSGVEIGVTAEIEGFIEKYKSLYPDIHVILTGGDIPFFEKRLKKPIFVDSFLILKGLNAILEYNMNAQ